MKKSYQLKALAAAMLIGSSIHAHSQALEEIIVTATKQMETVQDVPIAMSAIQGDKLAAFGISSTQDLQFLTPSLVYTNRSSTAAPFIRGIGTKLALIGLEPSIATYVDDQYFSRPTGAIMEMPDIERVEILMGPQGTLFGRNATGGAIRIVTKTPGGEFGGKATVTAGNYDYQAASLYVNGSITDDLAANFSLMTKTRDGFAENLAPGADDMDDLDTQLARTKWAWDVSDTVLFEFSADYSTKKDTQSNETVDVSKGSTAVSVAMGGKTGTSQDKVYNNTDTPNEIDMFNFQARLEVSLENMDFVAVTTYSDLDAKVFGDFDGTDLNVVAFGSEETAESFSQEFQLISNDEGDLEWITGLYYFNSDGDYKFDVALGIPGGGIIYAPQTFLETEAVAVYGQATYHFDDAWSLTVGGRYSYEEKEIRSVSTGISAPNACLVGAPALSAGIECASADEQWDEFTPKATLEYNTDNAMYYFTYSRGFKSGGFGYPLNPVVASEPLDSEILDMFEMGMKSDWADGRVRLNGAVFYYDYQDLQVNRNANAGGGFSLIVQNAADAEVTGLELNLDFQATENLVLTSGATFLDTEFKDYDTAGGNVWNPGAPFPGNVVMQGIPFDASGENMPQAPEFSAFVSANYVLDLPSSATMPMTLTYSYKSDFDYNLVTQDPGPGQVANTEVEGEAYAVVNGRVAYLPESEAWEVAVWGKNLTDEEYFDEVVDFTTGVRASYGAPRTYGVDFTYNF